MQVGEAWSPLFNIGRLMLYMFYLMGEAISFWKAI
jgi:hypothetical protein